RGYGVCGGVEPAIRGWVIDVRVSDDVRSNRAEGSGVGRVDADERRERESRPVRDDSAELPAPEQRGGGSRRIHVGPALAERKIIGPAPRDLVSLVAIGASVVGGDIEAVLGPRGSEADLTLIALGDAVRVRGEKPESHSEPLVHFELKPVV